MPEGKVIIFSAPSGAGKTTITRHVLQVFSQLEFSVSATTRPQRGHEANGKDYYFISQEDFRQKIEAGAFVEWEEVYKNGFYGTLKSEVERIWNKGHHVVFDVDVKGGINLKKIYGEKALSVFVMPPSIETLEKRLRRRNTDSEESIRARVKKAFTEIDYYQYFDIIILNDKLELSTLEAENLVGAFIGTP